jgi:hypothetical protein
MDLHHNPSVLPPLVLLLCIGVDLLPLHFRRQDLQL